MNPDLRPELNKLFRSALARHGLTKKVLENNLLRHQISHGYRKGEQLLAVSGDLYCPELSKTAKMFSNWPCYQYVAGRTIGHRDSVIHLGNEIDVEALDPHFDLVLGQAVVPIVRSVQTPLQAVQYAIANPNVMPMTGPALHRTFQYWANHFEIPYCPPAMDEDDELWYQR